MAPESKQNNRGDTSSGASEKKKLLLRLSPEIYAELVRWADDEFRSINGQIEFLLTQSVRNHRKNRADKE